MIFLDNVKNKKAQVNKDCPAPPKFSLSPNVTYWHYSAVNHVDIANTDWVYV